MGTFNKREGATKTGLTWKDPSKNDVDTFSVLLYDFDIDDWALKENHISLLREAIEFMTKDIAARRKSSKQIFKNAVWKVLINGYASKTGTGDPAYNFAHNSELSAYRAQSVQQYLVKNIWGLKEDEIIMDFIPNGFAKTTVVGENPLGRSVNVLVQLPGFAIPDEIKIPQPEKPGSTKFAIKILEDISVSKFLSAEIARFQIVDIAKKATAFFDFNNGWGVSIPIPYLDKYVPPVSYSTGGKFTNFETTKPVTFEDFAGKASILQGPGAGPLGFDLCLTIDSLSFLKKGVSIKNTKRNLITMDTGFQIGISMGSGVEGELKMEPQQTVPYVGTDL
jgi:hypothetical protein